MNHKTLVEQIHKQKARNESNDEDLARSLDVLSHTVFGDPNRFIFELLQNADDASTESVKQITVTFRLLNNHLVFSHDGKHFTDKDVAGLSGVASRKSGKDEDQEKTGYKGIGFKSVFGSSHMVQVISGGYSFRYDKNYPQWLEGEYPWQVIPIWTDNTPAETQGRFNPDHVTTIIAIEDRATIEQEIKEVFNDCQIILFLRHVHKVVVLNQDTPFLTIEKQLTQENTVHLLKNDRLHSTWMLKDHYLAIEDQLRDQLKKLSPSECPDKLKKAVKTKLTFAAQIEGNKFIQARGSYLYCYLPTKVNRDFMFLINGDFLTNAERTQLMPNVWNNYLFEQIAYLQLLWFRDLQATAYKYQVLHLFRDSISSRNAETFDKAFNERLGKEIRQIKFLPRIPDGQLITLDEGFIDTYGLSTILTPKEIATFFKQNRHIIDRQVEKQSSTDKYAKPITIDDIFKIVSEVGTPNNGPAIATRIIHFFYENVMLKNHQEWQTRLSMVPFIPDEQFTLKTAKELFFPVNIQDFDVSGFGTLNFIHPEVLRAYETTLEVLEWLHTLGIRDPEPVEIVRKTIIPMIQAGQVTQENAVATGRYIFTVYRSGKLTDQDYKELTQLKLMSSNGLKFPTECYLPDEYAPSQQLSGIIADASFIMTTYVVDADDYPGWGTFLKKLGVRDTVDITILPNKVERGDFISTFPYSKEYFEWVDKEVQYPALYQPYRNSGQHSISHFTEMAFRDHLQQPAFSKMFWSQELAVWKRLKEQCAQTTYFYYGGNNKISSYVEYYVRHYPAIPCTDNTCRRSSEIYAPHLKHIVNGVFPAADLDMGMTKEQIAFFGFKDTLSDKECLTILENIVNREVNSDLQRQINGLYEELMVLGEQSVPLIQQWRQRGKLLAENNTFQPVNNLFCLNIPGIQAPVDGTEFIKVPASMSIDDIRKLCEVLMVPFITYEQLKFTPDESKHEETLKIALVGKSRYLAIMTAHTQAEKPQVIYERLLQTLKPTSFYTAKALHLVYSYKGRTVYDAQIDAWIGPRSFYFKGDWKSPLQRYTISNKLCEMLQLNNLERELDLILQLEDYEIQEWMLNKGYNLEELSNMITPSHIDPIQVEVPEATDDSLETFAPEVTPSQIDYSTVRPVTKHNIANQPTIQYGEMNDQKTKTAVGRWAEEFVFNYLNSHPDQFSDIRWMNRTGESSLPYDFIVSEAGIERYIEVKGSPSSSKDIVYFSQPEWQVMFAKGELYSIFRIYGVGNNNCTLERIDNPKALAEDGQLLDTPIAVRV